MKKENKCYLVGLICIIFFIIYTFYIFEIAHGFANESFLFQIFIVISWFACFVIGLVFLICGLELQGKKEKI